LAFSTPIIAQNRQKTNHNLDGFQKFPKTEPLGVEFTHHGLLGSYTPTRQDIS